MKVNELKTGETGTFGIVTVTRLETGYYSFLWNYKTSTFTELVHPWNVSRRLSEICLVEYPVF